MAAYLLQVAYTPDRWREMIADPKICIETIRQFIEQKGGRFLLGFLAFGEYDVVVIYEASDNVSAAALSIALSARGVYKAIKTTPLMTAEETKEALRKAK